MTQAAVEQEKKNKLRSNFVFLGKFFQQGVRIASVWPSSKSLSKATVGEVDWDNAKVIVELGAGTGPITEVIIQRLKPHTHFIAIERDKDLYNIVRDRFAGMPNVEILHNDAADLDKILQARGIEKVDYIISCLATPSLPEPVRESVWQSVRKYLSPHGVYSNITEFPLIYWKYYKNFFHDVDFKFVPVNFPPGGVYHCRAIRE